ncbi:hypothetical protein [Kribbella italica]|uniref:Uncharacterized protein n=1 Tax=Kribbella italica TaxID=1540520 RepID=A0A7W9MTL5_9ACTN|nr:hypothetical protein [Kribbella italica]MBB5835322.1 hypothetical protein [Kribbella italica]
MAEPGDRTPEQDDAARVADTRRAMELGMPPARGTTAPGHGRARDDDQTADRPHDGVRHLDDQRSLREEAAGGATGGGGAAAGGAAAAAAGPPIGMAAEKAKEAVEKVRAATDAHTAEEIWKASEPSSQGAAPEHRRRPGQGRPPNQQSDRSGPGHRGPNR